MKEIKRRLDTIEKQLKQYETSQVTVKYKDGRTKVIPEAASAIHLVLEEGAQILCFEGDENSSNCGILLSLLNALLDNGEGCGEI